MSGFACNHVAFNCRDVAAQERFYMKHFGFKRSRTFRRGEPNEFIMLKLGSMRLELFPTDSLKTAGGNTGEQAVGFKHFAFDVPALEPMLDTLKAEGMSCDPIIDLAHVSPGLRIAFFRDPEGNIIELMENYADEA